MVLVVTPGPVAIPSGVTGAGVVDGVGVDPVGDMLASDPVGDAVVRVTEPPGVAVVPVTDEPGDALPELPVHPATATASRTPAASATWARIRRRLITRPR
jgi:hypothetical protein